MKISIRLFVVLVGLAVLIFSITSYAQGNNNRGNGGNNSQISNLINNMPQERYRHAIICLKDATDFRNRINRKDVSIYEMGKKDGKDLGIYFRLWKLLRTLRPQVVHTRNLGTIESLIPAVLAGVKHRVHGEHGRDVSDLQGTNKKHLAMRKMLKPLINTYIALSKALAGKKRL